MTKQELEIENLKLRVRILELEKELTKIPPMIISIPIEIPNTWPQPIPNYIPPQIPYYPTIPGYDPFQNPIVIC